MSQGVLSPLTNHASITGLNNEASSAFAPKLVQNIPSLEGGKGNDQNNQFSLAKGNMIKRDSIVFKMDQNYNLKKNNSK